MSQFDFGTIDPDTKNGADLADDLNDWRDAVHSNHRGISRPAYASAGMIWIKEVSSSNWEIYAYDGDSDILLQAINPTTNVVIPATVASGGTGANSASGARTNLGLVIGTDIQAYNAKLAAMAALTGAADKLGYFTGTSSMSTTDFPAQARTFLAASSTALQRAALGLVIGTDVAPASASPIGVQTMWVPAAAMSPQNTNGVPLNTIEMATNKQIMKTADFDPSTIEYAQFTIRMPKSWNLGNLDVEFCWSHATTTTNFGVVWVVRAVALSNNEGFDQAWGGTASVVDTGGTADRLYVSPASNITVGSTPVAEDFVAFQVYRGATDGSDNLAVDARLHGVTIKYTTNAATDA